MSFVQNTAFQILCLNGDGVPADYPVQGQAMLSDYEDLYGFDYEKDIVYCKLPNGGTSLLVHNDVDPEIKRMLTDAMHAASDDPAFQEAMRVSSYPQWTGPDELMQILLGVADASEMLLKK